MLHEEYIKSITPPEEGESKPIKEKVEPNESDEEAEIDKQITELQVNMFIFLDIKINKIPLL